MALARVVAFEDVTPEHIEELRRRMMETDGPPADIPASEFMVLHDPSAGKSLAILFFENDDDYARGHATLDAMPADETPGRRTSVSKYEVPIRMATTPATTA
jgi:hypothetical protein